MFSIKTLSLGLTLALAAPLAADTYTMDPAHTEIGFQTLHLGISKVRGHFTAYEGKVNINEKDITKSSLEVSISAASVETGNPKRNGHLGGPDFFDADKNPKITFKSSKIVKTTDGYDVSGDLTIRGNKKPVTLKATISDLTPTPWGVSKRAFSLEGSINRMDYGVAWGAKTPGGTLVVAEQVKLIIDGELDKPDAKKK